MMPEASVLWSDVVEVVDEALELDPRNRAAFVDQRCARNPALRRAVEHLLGDIDQADPGFLAGPAVVDAAPLLSWVGRCGLTPGTTFGPYEITGVLGRGGMATVYLADDHKHHRRVAVKVLDPDIGAAIGREWFLREIDIAAALHHPHILPLHDSGEVNGLLYYVMPHVEGESLRQRLAHDGRMPLAAARRIVQEVAGALDYAHRQGVVHRDIKPENILLQDGQAIVADFGIARAIAAGAVEVGMADTIPAVGTPAYMSPEQATRSAILDGRTDVYSLGCVLYEILAGRTLFGDLPTDAILEHHASVQVPSLRAVQPEVPRRVEHAIMRALEKSPDARFATAGELVRALDEAAPAAAVHGAGSRMRSLLVAVVVATAVLATGYLTRQTRAEPPTDPKLVAVLPFRTSGTSSRDLRWMSEGLVDLLTVKLAGEGGLRAVEPRAVLSAWRRVVGSEAKEVGPEAALEIARRVGAGRVIDGSVVGTPGHLILTASMLAGSGDRSTIGASVEGPMDSLSALVDRLTAQLLSLQVGTEAARLSSLTSTSLPAVRAYLAGRAAFRTGRFREGYNHFRDATLLDSTFALAALELLHAAKWVDRDSEDAQRALRLALAGRTRLVPADRALLSTLAHRWLPSAELIGGWRAATVAYPDRAEFWYGLGDAYYHFGMLTDLADPLGLARQAFQRGWALDSASGADTPGAERSPVFAEPLSHMVEIAFVQRDTASVRRFVALGLSADSTSAEEWYLRWLRAAAVGDSARRAFWADSQRIEPDAFALMHRFTASAGVVPDDYVRSAALMRRHHEADDRGSPDFDSHVLALNGGRPQEAARILTGKPDVPGLSANVGLPMREALYWGGDTTAAVEVARRLVPRAAGATLPGEAGKVHIRSLCTLTTWRLSRGDYRYAEAAARRLRESTVRGLAERDSIVMIEYKTKCAALLEATRATALRLPNARGALERADSAARADESGMSLGANLVVARLAEAQGDLPLALRAVRRRANEYVMLPPWYLSTFLREEGRLAALTGDTTGAIRAYRHYLALRPNPEPGVAPEVEGVRAALAALTGS